MIIFVILARMSTARNDRFFKFFYSLKKKIDRMQIKDYMMFLVFIRIYLHINLNESN